MPEREQLAEDYMQQYLLNFVQPPDIERLQRENRILKRLLVLAMVAGTYTWLALIGVL